MSADAYALLPKVEQLEEDIETLIDVFTATTGCQIKSISFVREKDVRYVAIDV